MSFKMNGLDELAKELKQISKNAQALAGTHEYSFDEIFPNKFMIENTNFSTIEEFLLSSPEKISSNEELEKADETILDTFVSEQTKFSTWEEMLSTATERLILDRLGF